ncbi:XTP/dITP diphosphohydrolase [Caminicella sporogenes DSM 14501]|uniref:dITP/XTP pyrophosphatase n=1 Tax=Caminicella sporogenes DSM 14501 TaxID=1121266 RepID=A0A1M6NVW8_9FIRM|nr:XTP/dITP diphosphatase [Caminicella sporogenes]RKD21630.1 non-canonical purine NTP pyrophosphatase, RdgB/HAM1 family [Caminicella sporogenes]SHJ99764.1 XTP/dITP diphosphohydrolase [Caminicella sporogenes DSM 14501]
MVKIVLASKNKHKLQEIKEILKELNIELVSMDDVGLESLEIIEDGNTFEENSMKKAVTVMEKTNLIALADDSGLEVDYLDGRPGVYSSRFAGENATDDENNKKLLESLKDVDFNKRTARFVSVISVVRPDGKKLVVRGECEGIIGFEKKGTNGFGYDPLFIVPEYNKTFAQLGPEIKNKISHRAKALEKLRRELNSFLGDVI